MGTSTLGGRESYSQKTEKLTAKGAYFIPNLYMFILVLMDAQAVLRRLVDIEVKIFLCAMDCIE